MGPFILLAVTKGAFGPWDDRGEWRYSFLWDVLMVLGIVVGGIVSILVLGEVLAATSITRWIVVIAGCLSLALLAAHMLSEVWSLYRSRSRSPRE